MSTLYSNRIGIILKIRKCNSNFINNIINHTPSLPESMMPYGYETVSLECRLPMILDNKSAKCVPYDLYKYVNELPLDNECSSCKTCMPVIEFENLTLGSLADVDNLMTFLSTLRGKILTIENLINQT